MAGRKSRKYEPRFFYNLNKSIVLTELRTYFILYNIQRVTRWCSSLRHCYKIRKASGWILGGVLGITFFSHNRRFNIDSNRNEYKECFLGRKAGRWVGLTSLPHSCAGRLEIYVPQTSGTLRAPPGL